MERAIRILIVDDHPLIRYGLQAVLSQEHGLLLVGQAGSGLEAIDLCRKLRPDVVLMDLLMPGMDGAEATRAILSENHRPRVLILTSSTDILQIIPAARAGASGYVLKNTPSQELIEAIRAVGQGQTILPEAILAALEGSGAGGAQDNGIGRLTRRELEIVGLIAHGLSNDGIADKLVLSRATVGVHVSNILNKLGLENRTQLALLAVHNGWVVF